WWSPLPLYVEHSLFSLFTTAAIAGYWAALREAYLALRKVASVILMKQPLAALLSSRSARGIFRLQRPALAAGLIALLVAASIPTAATLYARRAGPTAPDFVEPFPDEPKLLRYLGETIRLRVGGEFRGSLTFVAGSVYGGTMFNLWIQGIPTANEYSQLVTP